MVKRASVKDTDWVMIVSLYDTLMEIRPSPIIAMNRAIAIAHCDGPEQGLEELQAIESQDRLSSYRFYAATFGEKIFRLPQI
jgi:RNA polymerase sigma-70 factor (ECF subfamily)